MNKRWIITAAHCVDKKAPESVATGSVSISGGTIYKLEKVVLHENWSRMLAIADIALLKTSEDIRLDANVQPIPLATSDQVLSKAVVSGWGYVNMWFPVPPKILQFLEVDVLDNEDCRQRFKKTYCEPIDCYEKIYPSSLCTLNPYGKPYHGDSGGPLVADGKLVGLVSWGRRSVEYPDVFTRVSEYSEWIKKTMKEF